MQRPFWGLTLQERAVFMRENVRSTLFLHKWLSGIIIFRRKTQNASLSSRGRDGGVLKEKGKDGDMNGNVLLVDDEKALADLIEIYLKNDGYTVYKFYKGMDALQCVEERKLDLAILDVMLPDFDGFRLCQKIRETHFFPIIMLTAKVEDADKIMGLTMGADDYLTKPFNPLELMARVKTQLRRSNHYNRQIVENAERRDRTEYDIHGLTINRETHKCFLYGEELALTPIEFSLLWYLSERRGKVVPSDELFEAVWGEKYYDNTNTVVTHIKRLREKLKEPSKKPNFIKTVWGVGYKIE